MNSSAFFRYVPGDSKIHLLNSKMKILWFLVSLISVVLIRDYISLIIVTIYYISLCLISKINIDRYIKNLLILWPLYTLVGLFVFLISFNVKLSIIILMDVILIVLLFLILTSTTSLSEIAWGFDCLFGGLKKIGIPISKISLRIAMHIKFVEVLFNQYKNVRKSMAYRGVSYGKGLKYFRKMIIPIILLSYKLSRRTSKIMKLRFYGKFKKRTNYHENKKTNFDKILVVISFVILYVIIWLGWC